MSLCCSKLNFDVVPTPCVRWVVLQQTGEYLYAGLVELGDARELLAAVDVGVVRLSECGLQLLELLLREGGAVAAARGRGARGRVVGARRVPRADAATAQLRLQLLECSFC